MPAIEPLLSESPVEPREALQHPGELPSLLSSLAEGVTSYSYASLCRPLHFEIAWPSISWGPGAQGNTARSEERGFLRVKRVLNHTRFQGAFLGHRPCLVHSENFRFPWIRSNLPWSHDRAAPRCSDQYVLPALGRRCSPHDEYFGSAFRPHGYIGLPAQSRSCPPDWPYPLDGDDQARLTGHPWKDTGKNLNRAPSSPPLEPSYEGLHRPGTETPPRREHSLRYPHTPASIEPEHLSGFPGTAPLRTPPWPDPGVPKPLIESAQYRHPSLRWP
mmetsp:Transcript_6298/g.12542  ORF Transcript_6298/g.12542 Transcript_6298/m.12542 type:complete len:274 (-) Transcript_6298:118-939(-)